MPEPPSPTDPEEEPVPAPVVIPPPARPLPATVAAPTAAAEGAAAAGSPFVATLRRLLDRRGRRRPPGVAPPADVDDAGPLVIDLLAPPPNRHRSRDRSSN